MRFAVAVIRAIEGAGVEPTLEHAMKQLARAATSVAANYRAAGLARSRAEFLSKISIVLEEADEVVFWLDFLAEVAPGTAASCTDIRTEAHHLVRIFAASRRTVRQSIKPIR